MKQYRPLLTTIAYGIYAALTLLSVNANAKETPPLPSAPRAITLPNVERLTLSNGLKLTLIPYGSVPKVTLAAIIRTGHIDQGEQLWLPDLVGELMKEGSLKSSATELANRAAVMGGELTIAMHDDTSTVGLDVLSDHTTDAIQLLSEVLLQPRFPAAELPRIKQDYLRQLSVMRSQPQVLASTAFTTLLYGTHPYAHRLPSEAMILQYTIDDIKQFYQRYFGALRTHIFVVGQFDRTQVIQALQNAFATCPPGVPATRLPATSDAGGSMQLIDRPAAPQSTLILGLPVIETGHPDFLTVSLMNTLLGGSLTSRITSNIRENKGWAYSPSATLNANVHTATWVESADVTSAYTGATLKEIFKEIVHLQTEPPSQAELTAVQNYRHGLFLLSTATRLGLLRQYSFLDLHELPDEWLRDYVAHLYAITPEQVSAAARQYLDINQMSLSIVGDLKTVRKQLEVAPELKDFKEQ